MTARRIAASIVAAASVVVLAGCTGATGRASGGCDPSGMSFGNANGCGGSGHASSAKPASYSNGCDPSGFGPLSGCSGGGATSSGAPFHCDPDADCALSARHEAGHKAVADEYGWSVESVTISPDGDGATTVRVPCSCPEQRVVLALAGAVSAGTAFGAEDDFASANDDLKTVPKRQWAQVKAHAQGDAERIVAKRRAQIDRDAAQLRETGRL
jgi:hypothetical protein